MPLLDTPVRLGVQLAPQHAAYPELRDGVRRLEDMGVDTLFTWDHFFPLSGDPEGRHFECWTLLAAWAEQTERIELGPLVNCNGYRNPDLQADMARTLDHISGGRFVFGTGAGWADRDFEAYGYEYGTPGSRLRELEQGLARIVARWERLNPAPLHRIPILIGGKGEQKTLRLVARHADIWHSVAPVGELPHKISVIERWAEVEGRDTSELVISNDLRRCEEADAEAFYSAGVRLFTLGITGPEPDFEGVARWIAWRDAHNS